MSPKDLSAKVFDSSGKEKGTLPLGKGFGGVIRQELLHGAVRWQRAKKRAGTHSVLTRSNIKGGAKKPWKQKGTGRARAGSSVSPLWVGGAVVHGPTPRSYEFRMPKAMKIGALSSALSVKSGSDAIMVLENAHSFSGKTKDGVKLLEKMGVGGTKTLVVLPNEKSEESTKLTLGLRNIPGVRILNSAGVNVYDLLNAQNVVCLKGALEQLEARLAV